MLRSTRFIGSAPLTRSSAVSNGVKTIIPSLPVRLQSPSTTIPPLQRRTFLTRIFRPPRTEPPPPPPPQPFYGQDELFHPLDQSPILAMRRRAESIKRHAPCPTCITEIQQAASNVVTDSARTADTTATATATATPTEKPLPKSVHFSCPSCGFPTHCSEGHYLNDTEAHSEFCSRLREINEDEHDLRSGRLISEFELPADQDYETTPSLSSWDTLFYTRNFSSINSDRAKRHVSKLLTYPMTIASVLHRMGPFAGSGGGLGGRLTKEGSRSMAALHTALHPPLGADPSATSRNTQTPIRLFLLGARSESSLPPHVYEQICHLFPFTRFEIFFIGPQAAQPSRPLPPRDRDPNADPKKDGLMFTEKTPLQNSELNKKGLGRVESDSYGVPAYTVPVSSTLTLTSLQTTYETVHEQFAPFDPYTDVFFAFCPGFGFPSPSTPGKTQGEVEWKESIQKVLETKCPLFVTGFSPRDVERDINSLDAVEGVRGEYDILLRPGENGYASLKWEAGDFDPRVMVRVNWGVWGMRGKSYEVEQKIREE